MRRERGLSLLGALLIVVIAAIAGYYVYQGTLGEEPPTCDSALKSCMQKCRRTTSDAAAAQACQKVCESDAEDCKRQKRRAETLSPA